MWMIFSGSFRHVISCNAQISQLKDLSASKKHTEIKLALLKILIEVISVASWINLFFWSKSPETLCKSWVKRFMRFDHFLYCSIILNYAKKNSFLTLLLCFAPLTTAVGVLKSQRSGTHVRQIICEVHASKLNNGVELFVSSCTQNYLSKVPTSNCVIWQLLQHLFI